MITDVSWYGVLRNLHIAHLMTSIPTNKPVGGIKHGVVNVKSYTWVIQLTTDTRMLNLKPELYLRTSATNMTQSLAFMNNFLFVTT